MNQHLIECIRDVAIKQCQKQTNQKVEIFYRLLLVPAYIVNICETLFEHRTYDSHKHIIKIVDGFYGRI